MTNFEGPTGDSDYQPIHSGPEESVEAVTRPDEDVARAIGGEGAVELEATAPQDLQTQQPGSTEAKMKRIVIPPVSEAERDEIRREADPTPKRARNSGLIAGPNGQMVSTGRKGRRGSWDQRA